MALIFASQMALLEYLPLVLSIFCFLGLYKPLQWKERVHTAEVPVSALTIAQCTLGKTLPNLLKVGITKSRLSIEHLIS